MKVLIYIDGEHNTVEVKDKIKSVLPDANYMIFDHTENKGKVTNYERIKNMSVEEMAETLLGGQAFCPYWMYSLIGKCAKTDCQKCIKQWLETEME